MLKSPLLILAILLCLGLGTGFWLNKTSEPPSTVLKIKAPTANPPRLQQKPRDPAAYRDQLKEIAEIRDANDAWAAAYYTPEIQKKISLLAKSQLKKTYASLFKKWELDEAKAEAALALIWERDEAIRNARYKRYNEGRSGLNEFEWTRLEEVHAARFQLELVLGKQRTSELCQMETNQRMDALSIGLGEPKDVIIKRLKDGRTTTKAKAPSPPAVFKRD
jgi:hypothetical protein